MASNTYQDNVQVNFTANVSAFLSNIQKVVSAMHVVGAATQQMTQQMQTIVSSSATTKTSMNNVSNSAQNLCGNLNSSQNAIGNTTNSLSSTSSKLQNIAEKMKNIGKTMSLAITTPLSIFGKKAVEKATWAEEMLGKFDVVFGDMAKETDKWAENLSSKIGRSKLDIKDMANEMQDTLVPLGFERDKAAQITKEMVAVSIDSASINNKDEKETMRDFISAMVGNVEAVRKYGMVLTQSRLKSEAINMGLIQKDKMTMTKDGKVKKEKVGKQFDDLSETEKALVRLKIIKDSSKDAIGDAERSMGHFESLTRQFNATLTDTKVIVGSILQDFIKPIMACVRQLLIWFNHLPEPMQKLIVINGIILATVGPLLIVSSLLINSFLTVQSAIGKIHTLIRGATALQSIFNAVTAINPVFLIVAGIIAAVTAIGVLIHKTIGFRRLLFNIGQFFTNTLPRAILRLVDFITIPAKAFLDLATAPLRMIGITPKFSDMKFENLMGANGRNTSIGSININTNQINSGNVGTLGNQLGRSIALNT